MGRNYKRGLGKSALSLILFFCLLLLVVVVTQLAFGQEYEDRPRRRNRGENPNIKLGEFPPDFELPILTIDTDGSGKHIGRINDNDTIKLSSLYGKKPVCIFMSSYT